MKLTKIDSIIWSLTALWLIIDTITGFFLNNGVNFPLSQFFKIGISGLISYRLSQLGYLSYIYFWIIYLSVIFLNCAFLNESIGDTFTLLSKLILTYLFYQYFCIFSKWWPRTLIRNSKRILLISFCVVSINIISGLFGFGFNTYPDEHVGFKGFFYAGNELGGVMAVLTPFFLYYSIINYTKLKFIFVGIFCIVLSVILGTKAFMLVSVISFISISWMYGTRQFRLYLYGAVIIIIIISIPIIISLFSSNEIDLLIRFSHSYDKGGISSIIFSNRDEFWISRSADFFNSDIITQLFGLGGNRTVEMDHLDVLLNYGYVGVVIIYSSILYLIIRSYLYRYRNSFSKVVLLINILLLGMSFIAGHIVFSSMAGMFIALVNAVTRIPTHNIIYAKKNSNSL